MKNRFDYPNNLEPFSVDDELLNELLTSDDGVDDIEGYKGDPISGVGDVYTPRPIVEFILDSVGYTTENKIEHQKIADLSCGTGSFIRVITERLRDRLIRIGYNPQTTEGARQIISTVKNNIYAYDINSLAVWRTAQHILRVLDSEIETTKKSNPVSTLPIFHASSLKRDTEISYSKFDTIVGNPPYIKNRDISDEDDEMYRKQYESAIGKYDTYLLFYERAAELLDAGGNLGFVTPDRFHHTDYGKKVREILLNRTHFELIVKLQDEPFPVVNAYPAMTILRRQDNTFPNYQRENKFKYCECNTADLKNLSKELDCSKGGGIDNCIQINQEDLDDEGWLFISPDIQQLQEKLRNKLPIIKNTDIRIKTGIATGADDIFILNESDAKRMSAKIVYPLVKGENVKKGHIKGEKHIINPYNKRGDAIDLDDYPEARKYLEYNKPALEERYCVREQGKLWYETHDTIQTDLETSERIVTPDLTATSRFAVTERRISHNTCYSFFSECNLDALAAAINSSVFEFLLKSSLPEMDSGFWRQMKRDLVDLPVPHPSQFSAKVNSQLEEYYQKQQWDLVDDTIYDSIDLKTEEISLIESLID
jgi:methylase of polypeptide subunit release factors